MNNNPNIQTQIVDSAAVERRKLYSRYHSARVNILSVVIFTFVNVLIWLFGGNTYFLFSASIPFALVDYAMLVCGKYPIEYYGLEEGHGVEFYGNGVFVFLLALAFVGVALYLLCGLMAKKHGVGWIIGALAMFVLDTGFMFYWWGFSVNMMIDVAIHIWVLVSLVLGVIAHYKLKKLPDSVVRVTVDI